MISRDILVDLRADLAAAIERVDSLIAAHDAHQSAPKPEVDIVEVPRTVAIERVLEAAGVAMRPVEIWAALREAGRSGDPKTEVQVTTHDLSTRGRIRRVDRGLYAALSASVED